MDLKLALQSLALGHAVEEIQVVKPKALEVGAVAVADAKSSPYSYIAHEQARLLFIRKADFIAVLTKNPSLWLSVAQHLADLLRVALDTVQEQTFEGVRARLARSLLSLAQSREQDTSKLRSLRYTQEDLAGLLGVSRQSISKQLKRLEREGFIRILYGKVELNDEDGLKHIAFN